MVESADPTALTHAIAAIRSAPSSPSSSGGGGVASSVTVSALPLPPGAACDGADGSNITPPAGGTGIRGWLSGIYKTLTGTVKVDGSAVTQPVSGSVAISGNPILNGIINPVAVTGNFYQATQPVSLAVNTPDVVDRAGRLLGHVTIDALPTTATRAVKDTARTPIILSAMAVPSVTSEAMFTLNRWVNGTVTSGTSYTVTAGKTFRVQALQYGCRFATNSTTVTFASTKINFRSGSTITSPLIYGDSKMAASNMATPNSDLPVPDGLEFAGGTVLGFSHLDSATTLLLDLVLVGFEY